MTVKKFIRTQSGEIYDVDDLYVNEDLSGKPYCEKGSGWCIYKESIIKESDNIEDLFDCLVIVPDEGFPTPYYDDKIWVKRNGKRVFGAVWTQSGLKYVREYKEREWRFVDNGFKNN